MKAFALASTVLASLPLFATAANDQGAKAQAVRDAITGVQKINALEDKDFVFDFTDPAITPVKGDGGKLISANVGNFAALVGQGLAMTLGSMEPCGINTPHTHPRATEILLVLNGTIQSGFVAENGARFVMNEVTEYSAMVFPRGSIHFQANLGCERVDFVAALSEEDPGTLQIAQGFFTLPPDVVGPTLGGLGSQEVTQWKDKIPKNLVAGTEECRQRCYGHSSQPPPPPSTTTHAQPNPTAPPAAKKTIQVEVGPGGQIKYSNDNIRANIGDTVRFAFMTKNHTVTQSSFDYPCTNANTGVDSGFRPVTNPNATLSTFDIVVKDDKPIWFYCQQGQHCPVNGMNGAINPPETGDKTLAAFKAKASALANPQQPPAAGRHYINVDVGPGGQIKYSNDNIKASVGDIIRFNFLSKNHTVTQSSFDNPCTKADRGFDSGFRFVDPNANGTLPQPFEVEVKNDMPIWFYCQQGQHCAANGMNGGINAPDHGDKTLAAFKAKAKALANPSQQPPAPVAPRYVDVQVGPNGEIKYSNDDIKANIGDTVRFTFVSKNHTVTQSSFDTPCVKAYNGFDSGFRAVADPSVNKVFESKRTLVASVSTSSRL